MDFKIKMTGRIWLIAIITLATAFSAAINASAQHLATIEVLYTCERVVKGWWDHTGYNCSGMEVTACPARKFCRTLCICNVKEARALRFAGHIYNPCIYKGSMLTSDPCKPNRAISLYGCGLTDKDVCLPTWRARYVQYC